MKLLLDFPHNYEVIDSPELPGSGGRVIYYPGARTDGGKDGVIALVRPEGSDLWWGVFAYGVDGSYMEANGIYSCPNPDQLCVVSDGTAYLVNPNNPDQWSEVPAHPVLEVHSIVTRKLIIFVDFTRVAAIGSAGLVWITESLALDGIFIKAIGDETIRGTGTCLCREDAPHYEFVIDLRTGKHTGGWPR